MEFSGILESLTWLFECLLSPIRVLEVNKGILSSGPTRVNGNLMGPKGLQK